MNCLIVYCTIQDCNYYCDCLYSELYKSKQLQVSNKKERKQEEATSKVNYCTIHYVNKGTKLNVNKLKSKQKISSKHQNKEGFCF